ncbi:LysR family transcriptional regulator [Bordetella petrii]|uniref:LysR family transcriptional regulator n=1 Tax=Bordetella petrii TaxID=94624 RepID=UPI0038B37210
MDTKSLTLLVEILDAGNLSEAARRLKMTRANVSYHLNQLERAVGMQLVRRTTRRVEPTEIGLKLYQHGRSIRDELAAARESVESLGKTPQGRVRLSVPSGYGQFVMSPWLLEFMRNYPGIVLDVLFENSVEDLLREEVDLAVRIMSEPPGHLVARELGRVRYVACASPAYAARRGLPVRPEALCGAPIISAAVIGRPLRLSAYQGNQRQQVALEPTVVSRNYPFLRDAALAGLGIAVVPDYVVHEDIAQGRLLTALEQWRLSIFGRSMYLLYMPSRHHPRALAMLIEFILAKALAAHEGRPGLLPPG